MPRNKNVRLWIVVADAARARIYAPEGDPPKLAAVPGMEMASAEVRGYSRDLSSDKPGRTFTGAGSSVRQAMEPKHDYHKLEKHKFTVRVARALGRARNQKKFDALVVAAPRRSLGELRAVLSASVRRCIRAELAKDLTKAPVGRIWREVATMLACNAQNES